MTLGMTGDRKDLNALSIGGYISLVAAILLLFRADALRAAALPGEAAQVVAIALMIWARVTFGRRSFHASATPTEGGLVTTGPYRFIRHPIYAAVLLFIWATALTHLSLLPLAAGLLAIAGAAIRIVAEERLVSERYPQYRAYAARTKRLIPFVL